MHSLPSEVEREAPEPSLWWGHQADHNVKYTLGTIGNSVIENAISPAVAAWNSKLPEVGKGLAICPAPGLACNDSFTVTIKTVNNMNNSTSPRTDNPAEGCGTSRACVKPDGDGGGSAGPGRHMENMYIVFEDPPWFAVEERDAHGNKTGKWITTEYMWTDNQSLDEHVVRMPGPTRKYVYAGRVMLHEFGHTLGLPDFYNDATGLKHLDAIMNMSYVIEDEDIAQLRAIYLLHSSH